MKLGIFGGSFNPVHAGHVGLAERAIAELGLDKLLAVPAACNPFKAGQPGFFDDETRLRLVRKAFAGNPKVVVDEREIRKGGVSYAIDTVREVKAENPDAELFFIIGEDSVAGLPKWKDYPELVKLCRFVAYPRTRESSTEIRRRLEAGESVADMIPENFKE
ncbi:MAG: nicotinate (nicotinamide) nucleotide adenylyltransferase [Kiritimatiellae bacterium]|nr:nicotinate (nicotinamide) nucleotide adenylyltransferase [Kiritimatiellia bacterium]